MIEGLLPKYDVSLHISHNQHKGYYKSTAEYLSRPFGTGGFDPDEWISREDFDAAIAQDSVWEIQWYPDTPVASCTVYGSTFANALKAANS